MHGLAQSTGGDPHNALPGQIAKMPVISGQTADNGTGDFVLLHGICNSLFLRLSILSLPYPSQLVKLFHNQKEDDLKKVKGR